MDASERKSPLWEGRGPQLKVALEEEVWEWSLKELKTWRGGEGKEGVLAKRKLAAHTWRNALVDLVGCLPSEGL